MILNKVWPKDGFHPTRIGLVDNGNLSFLVQSKDLAERQLGKVKPF